MQVTDEMIENGCRGMYGKHWDGPADKQPGEEMKNVWRRYSRNCLEAALADHTNITQEELDMILKEHELMRRTLQTISATSADRLFATQALGALANIGPPVTNGDTT